MRQICNYFNLQSVVYQFIEYFNAEPQKFQKPQETNKDWQSMFNVKKLLFKNVKYFGLFMWAVPSKNIKNQIILH